jgi:hypothetical protein
MAAYLKANDPYGHLITTSYGAPGEPEVWQLPTIDLTQSHFYGDDGSVRDVVPVLAADARSHDPFQKPHFMGELGISWRRSDDEFDPYHTAANLHDGLWVSALSGDAGGTSIWYWYDYLRPRDLWFPFRSLARFAATIDWARRDFQPLTVASPTFNHPSGEFSDLVLTAAGGWGKADPRPLVAGPDGVISRTLPTFLYGPIKPDFRTKLTLKADLPKATRMIIRVARASAPCALQVSIDEHPAGRFMFKPGPETPGPGSGGKGVDPKYALYAIAESDRNRDVAVPQGAHTIVLDLRDGDWLTLESITLSEARGPGVAARSQLELVQRCPTDPTEAFRGCDPQIARDEDRVIRGQLVGYLQGRNCSYRHGEGGRRLSRPPAAAVPTRHRLARPAEPLQVKFCSNGLASNRV